MGAKHSDGVRRHVSPIERLKSSRPSVHTEPSVSYDRKLRPKKLTYMGGAMEEEVLEMELLPAQITVVVGRMSTVHHGVRLGALPLVAANQFFVSDVYEMVAYWLEVECDLKNVCFRLSYDAAEDASQGPNWVKLASPISLANLARLHVVVEEMWNEGDRVPYFVNLHLGPGLPDHLPQQKLFNRCLGYIQVFHTEVEGQMVVHERDVYCLLEEWLEVNGLIDPVADADPDPVEVQCWATDAVTGEDAWRDLNFAGMMLLQQPQHLYVRTPAA